MNKHVKAKDALRLIELGDAEDAASLEQGSSLQVEDGLTFTADGDVSQILLEISSQTVKVVVGETTVFDVGVVAPGQVFNVNDKPFVFLADKQAFLNRQAKAADERLNCTIPDVELILPKRNFIVKMGMLSTEVTGFCVIYFAGSLYLGKVETLNAAPSPNAVVSAQEAPAKLPDLSEPEVPKPADLPKPVAKTAVQTTAGVQAKPKVALVNPTEEQLTLFKEYVLESKFDPEGAKRKMRALVQRLPANSALKPRIQGYLTHH